MTATMTTKVETVKREALVPVYTPVMHLELTELEVATLYQLFSVVTGSQDSLRGVIVGIFDAMMEADSDFGRALHHFQREYESRLLTVYSETSHTAWGNIHFEGHSRYVLQAELDEEK